MNSSELCQSLDVSKAKLKEWVEAGLPYTAKGRGRSFNEEEVVEWLLAKGIAKPKVTIFETTAEVARYFGEKATTVKSWFVDQGCPGEPGAYVLSEIEDWIAMDQRPKGRPPKKRTDEEEEPKGPSVQDQLRLLKLETARGQLISLEEVKSEFVRQSNMIRSELGTLPAKIESRLPGELDKELVAMIREVVVGSIEECYATFREILEDEN